MRVERKEKSHTVAIAEVRAENAFLRAGVSTPQDTEHPLAHCASSVVGMRTVAMPPRTAAAAKHAASSTAPPPMASTQSPRESPADSIVFASAQAVRPPSFFACSPPAASTGLPAGVAPAASIAAAIPPGRPCVCRATL